MFVQRHGFLRPSDRLDVEFLPSDSHVLPLVSYQVLQQQKSEVLGSTTCVPAKDSLAEKRKNGSL